MLLLLTLLYATTFNTASTDMRDLLLQIRRNKLRHLPSSQHESGPGSILEVTKMFGEVLEKSRPLQILSRTVRRTFILRPSVFANVFVTSNM